MHGDRFYPKNTFLIGETERKNSFWFHFSPWAVLLFLLLLLLVFFLQTSDQALIFHACAVQGIITNLPLVVGYSGFLCFGHMQAKQSVELKLLNTVLICVP